MRKLLLCNPLAVALLAPLVAQAHSTNMTTITLALAADGSFEMVVQLDPGEKLLGYQRYFEISRMDEAARSRALAPLAQLLEKEMRLSFDGGRVLLQAATWTLPNAPYETFVDPTIPTMSQLKLRGAAPPRAERLDFTYTSALELPTPVLFRVDKAGERLPFSRVVDGPGAPMRSITLLKPPPPLLNERELVAAARVIHGARTALQSYRTALHFNWDAAILPLVICVSLALAHGAGAGWMWLQGLAALVVFAAALVTRTTGADVAPYVRTTEILLAGLAITAGAMAARRVSSVRMMIACACAAAVIWGFKTAGGNDPVTSPVLPAPATAVLHACGYAGAWLALGLLAKTLQFQVKLIPQFSRRATPVLGILVAGMGAYWLVHVV